MGFVCAFRGRRDSYQVPLALAEAGALDLFITDYYCGSIERIVARSLPKRLSERALRRFEENLPQDRIRRLSRIALAEAAASLANMPAGRLYAIFDPTYGAAAARHARRHKSDLFMYSPYAWEAFSQDYAHAPRKILFQFHPHCRLETDILGKDVANSERHGLVFSPELEKGVRSANVVARQKSDTAWQLADHVVCASSFTKRSLVEAGCKPDRISIAPYGINTVQEAPAAYNLHEADTFHALFVGSGFQRKGLHHLLMAWRRAQLPTRSRLTVVCRIVDRGLSELLLGAQGVQLLTGVTADKLRNLYNEATLFVMPSLVEGFGQVYLEALSHGLPVLGTRNTCLPDLGGENDGVYVTTPGDVDELAARLETLAAGLTGDRDVRRRARACAGRFTWERFRGEIRRVVTQQPGTLNSWHL